MSSTQSITFIYCANKKTETTPFGTKQEIQNDIAQDMYIASNPGTRIIYIDNEKDLIDVLIDEKF